MGIVVSTLQIIHPDFVIVEIPTVTERVNSGDAAAGGVGSDGTHVPCVVAVGGDGSAVPVGNGNDIALP